jgi:hypothetical protein
MVTNVGDVVFGFELESRNWSTPLAADSDVRFALPPRRTGDIRCCGVRYQFIRAPVGPEQSKLDCDSERGPDSPHMEAAPGT